MFKKIYNALCKLSMITGVIVIICAAGASDFNMIDFDTIILRAVVGLFLLTLGYIGLRIGGVNCE